MKKFLKSILILSLLVFLSCCAFDEVSTDSSKITRNKDTLITSIKEEAELIDGEKDLKRKILDNEWFVDHDVVRDAGTQLDGYFKDGKIFKIVETRGQSFELQTYEYYYLDEQLIMIHEINEIFPYIEETGAMDYTNLKREFEGYYFVNDGEIVEMKTAGTKRSPPPMSEEEFVSALISSSKENVELLTTGL